MTGMGANSVILWLRASATDSIGRVGELRSNFTDPAFMFWNGSKLQLHSSIDLSSRNITTWLEVASCHLPNQTDECVRHANSLTRVELFKEEPSASWVARSGMSGQIFRSCHQLYCSVIMDNVTWTDVTTQLIAKDFTFPVLFVIRVIGFISVDAVAPLLDATGLYMCKTHNGDFAQQKMWTMFSMVVIPFVCGALIDLFEEYKGFHLQPVQLLCITVRLTGYKEYGLAFAIGAVAALLVAPVIFKLNIQVQKNNQSLIKTARAVGKMLDVNVFLVVQVVMGLCWGFHFNFLAIYLNTEMKASKTILGDHEGLFTQKIRKIREKFQKNEGFFLRI